MVNIHKHPTCKNGDLGDGLLLFLPHSWYRRNIAKSGLKHTKPPCLIQKPDLKIPLPSWQPTFSSPPQFLRFMGGRWCQALSLGSCISDLWFDMRSAQKLPTWLWPKAARKLRAVLLVEVNYGKKRLKQIDVLFQCSTLWCRSKQQKNWEELHLSSYIQSCGELRQYRRSKPAAYHFFIGVPEDIQVVAPWINSKTTMVTLGLPHDFFWTLNPHPPGPEPE